MTHPSIVYPSHGGLNNPNWRYKPGAADVRQTINAARAQVLGPVVRVRVAYVSGRVVTL